jgi:hypothetical protein
MNADVVDAGGRFSRVTNRSPLIGGQSSPFPFAEEKHGVEPAKSADLTHPPGRTSEPAVFASLKAILKQAKGKEAIFQEEMCNGARWLVTDLLFSSLSSIGPFFQVVDAYDIYYRPCGKVTLEDVRALADKGVLRSYARPWSSPRPRASRQRRWPRSSEASGSTTATKTTCRLTGPLR